MKIIVYTITECQFSKQEKEYLAAHSLAFEEKNLETNREFLTEMLTISNNFAGTPVTKIEKEDGSIVVLKGFTKTDFDKALGFEEKKEEPAKTPEAKPAENAPAAPAAQPAVPAPDAAPAPAPVTAPAAVQPAPAPVPETSAVPAAPAQPDPMADILNNLAQQATAPDAAPAPAAPPAVPANGMPQIPDPQL